MRLFTGARPSRRFRPAMERLEDRHCPAVPTIMSMGWESGQQAFTLMGTVRDEQPGGLTVTFSGVYTGTATTNAQGGFSVQVQPTGLGVVTASVTDSEGLTSQPATVTLTSMPPMISGFMAVRQIDNFWTFTGTVTDESPAGLKVNFGGLPSLENKTVLANADGSFSLTVELAPGEEGTAWVQTMDWWGQSSSAATYWVHPSA